MYIKSIDIYGFKSFADKVHMDFNQGVTAIVGPNGSGKSNVADAVRWVLGEQSPKTLRGGKMQDVIFSGTQLRKPLSIAEVTLSIDNSNRVLPVDSLEATVTRRVLHSGENEYLINKAHSRLKDVTDLFLDTGLGKEGYSIIGQGRIDEILSIHPGERRHVFEQAAGIGKYKMHKEEAQIKLQKTTENIIRIEDIIYEIEQQLKQLKSQSDCALKFNAMRQELKIAEINKFLRLYKRCAEKLEQLNTQLKSHLEDLERLISRLSIDEYSLKEQKQRLNVVLKESEALKDGMHEKITMQERLKGEYDLIAQKLKRLFEDNKVLNEEIAKDEKKLSEIQVIISKSNESLLSNESIICEKRANLADIEQKLRYLSSQSAIDIKSVEQSRKEISSLAEELADLKTSSAKHETTHSGLTSERIELNNRSLAGIKHQKTLLDNKKIKLDIDVEESLSRLKLLNEKIVLLEKTKLKLQSESQKSEAEIEDISARKSELEEQAACLKAQISYHEREVSGLKERVRFQTADIERYKDISEKRKRTIHENMLTKTDLEADASLKKHEEQKLAGVVQLLNTDLLRKDEEKQSLIELLAALESSIEESRQAIAQNKDLQHRTELKISKLEAEKDHLDLYIWEEYQISYGHALKYFDKSTELNLIENKILSLKQDIEELGEVNINSIEDYSKLKVRYDSLCAQKQDLLAAKRNLDRVIEEMTVSMKKEFCAEFEIINENFSIVFSKLFGGGKAQLILEDESRPLDCGIEIAAQPPGKKLQSISLLSGGEKALTASAILFAILKRKPALFCVLDEIDAVLDESNLYNLGNFLKDFSDSTQFIIITHRKVTMEMCDTLYGVVMEEKGISKLVSVKLEGIAV